MKQKIDVTAAIIVKNEKVLTARRRPGIHLAGYWEFPGGKVKDGEAPEDCLARELQEEFHISTKVGPFFGENLYDYGSKRDCQLNFRRSDLAFKIYNYLAPL